MASLASFLRRETEKAVRCTARARFPFSRNISHDHLQRRLTADASGGYAEASTTASESPQRRRVAVFWDLDNKPPKLVRPFDAATRLKAMAAAFGEVVDVVACANHHAFEHVPSWVHDQRRQRKELDRLEASGGFEPEQPYVCGVCGAKKKTHVLLTKHFKMLHEREHKKRVNRLDSLRGKKKQKEQFRVANSEKMAKYKGAAESVLVPKVGYGLMQEIRRAGVYVRTVKDQPQAADIALKDHIRRAMRKGVKCICLVSDDTDFKSDLKFAREKKLHVIVVGDLKILCPYADTYFSWRDVASGWAEEEAKRLNGKQSLGGELGSGESGVPVGGSDILVEDESECESDDDGEWTGDHWRPIDRCTDLNFDEDQDYGSDDFSESDSEELSNMEKDGRGSHAIQRGWPTASKRGGKARFGLRTFMTSCKAEQVQPSPSKPEEKATSGECARPQSPQRLHYVFTRLEGAHGEQADSSKGRDSNGGNDPRHVSRVHDILKLPTRQEDPIRGSADLGPEERSQQLVRKAGEGSERSAPPVNSKVLDSSSKIDTSCSPYGIETPKDETPKSNRRPMRRRPATKTRVIKVVTAGPRPFYLSGFASESQAQCNAITRYYNEWWSDDGQPTTRKTERK